MPVSSAEPAYRGPDQDAQNDQPEYPAEEQKRQKQE